MKCIICKHGETQPGKITVTLEREGVTLVMRGVPAEICANCGEEYANSDVTKEILEKLNNAVKQGVNLEVGEYRAA